jgi:tyrosyl-tRNA synthetase
MVTGYAGFDPTADSLHIGNLVPITLLIHLQRAGHKPVALVGGATGMVGDPSGKNDERKLLDEETINHNLECQKAQLQKFLNFNEGENKAEMVNNYDWFSKFGFLEFIRDVGKHLTVNYMMSKDSVKNRLESGGLSFTEFSYQLVQGYDYYHLYNTLGCKLQVGGSDQWGNITTGTELIRRKAGGEAFAITAPLVTKSDGTKFGKSEGGNVWLDPIKTSPYKFYQFWLNVSDDDAGRFLKIYSLKGKEDIETIFQSAIGNESQRLVQKALAEELTLRCHGSSELESAQKATSIFFGNGSLEDLKSLQLSVLENMLEGIEKHVLQKELIVQGTGIVDLIAEKTNIFSSKGEARKMIQSNGFSMNKSKITDVNFTVNANNLLHSKYIIFQKGKKNYYLLEVE